MGCISSKQAKPASAVLPASGDSAAPPNRSGLLTASSSSSLRNPSGLLEFVKKDGSEASEDHSRELGRLRKDGSNRRSMSLSLRVGFSKRHVEVEQAAAGWPSWLSAVAGEAVHGWVPRRADSYEKLEKIGQGTYSSVYRACEVETGRMVALKKVRFDNFQPESVRFMAREILILRRLDHPNIMKLEGIVTSRLSCSIYLIFEYMEHDLSGLLSCPDIKFSDSQAKCYMKQLLSGIEHCHLRGVMHRDIKASNILLNNEGILKIADFGLANILNSKNKQTLTSRVVTLWYRPPELIMGSTNYGVSVDLWSVGCVFAELLSGTPILKGRTEVEQLHKIFKLCGSPPDEFWKKSKLPQVTVFKPQQPYESTLRERCKDFPTTAVNLIETLLSIEPSKRGTASSALMSEYFSRKPYACDPSSLPKYPPNKEIDAKSREDARRKKAGITRMRESGTSRKPRRIRKTLQEANSSCKFAPKEEVQENTQFSLRNNSHNAHIPKVKGGAVYKEPLKSSFDTVSDVSQGEIHDSGPAITASSGFAWAKRHKEDTASTKSYGSTARSQLSALDSSSLIFAHSTYGDALRRVVPPVSTGNEAYETSNLAMLKQRNQFDQQDSFNASNRFYSGDFSLELHPKEDITSRNNMDQGDMIEFSGPLISQPRRVDERLQRNESRIRRAARRSRFERDR